MAGQEMERILIFIQQYKEGTLLDSNREELDKWIEASKFNKAIFQELIADKPTIEYGNVDHLSLLRIQDKIKQRIGGFPIPDAEGKEKPTPAPVFRIRAKRWMSAAAITIIFLSGSFYFGRRIFGNGQVNNVASVENRQYALSPGGNKAILTLSTGKAIILEKVNDGALFADAGTQINKKEDGNLAYLAASSRPEKESDKEILYNTLSTPRGGQYLVKLSDGTKVWLNAASSLRYPVTFTGKERKVELTGEAYFEVVKNSNMPFHVQLDNMDVEVLGTQFNINSYADEPTINTTLLEGSVRISDEIETGLLSPGEQAQINKSGGLKIFKEVDTEKAIAWKNGMFQFKSEDIPSIMRQVARWYDVEISYEDNLPTRKFTGKIPRNQNASELLNMLEYIGIHFKIEGKEIRVMH